jgi:hypothetical protein
MVFGTRIAPRAPARTSGNDRKLIALLRRLNQHHRLRSMRSPNCSNVAQRVDYERCA